MSNPSSMIPSSDASNEISLRDVVEKLHLALEGQIGAPTLEGLGSVCDVLYAASFLKEEGEVVRARIVIAPPEEFTWRKHFSNWRACSRT